MKVSASGICIKEAVSENNIKEAVSENSNKRNGCIIYIIE